MTPPRTAILATLATSITTLLSARPRAAAPDGGGGPLLARLVRIAYDEHGYHLDEHAQRQLAANGYFAPFTADVTGDGSFACLQFVHTGGRVTLQAAGTQR